ncbi:MAG: helix-turn-helix transcriptional regulator [Candidatus Dormibacteria bacterium]
MTTAAPRLPLTHSGSLSDQILVRAPRAAEILDISERSLHRLLERGDLEAVRLADRIVRYRVEDLRALVAPHPAAWPPGMANGRRGR